MTSPNVAIAAIGDDCPVVGAGVHLAKTAPSDCVAHRGATGARSALRRVASRAQPQGKKLWRSHASRKCGVNPSSCVLASVVSNSSRTPSAQQRTNFDSVSASCRISADLMSSKCRLTTERTVSWSSLRCTVCHPGGETSCETGSPGGSHAQHPRRGTRVWRRTSNCTHASRTPISRFTVATGNKSNKKCLRCSPQFYSNLTF